MLMVNFRIEELVSPNLYELLGNNAWKLFDEEFLKDVDRFVSDLKRDLGVKSVTVNNWLWNGRFTQSGYREMNSSTGSPRSAHKRGLALDLKFNGCTVKEACNYLLHNQQKYSRIRRIEDVDSTPTWLHVDGVDSGKNEIHVFKP